MDSYALDEKQITILAVDDTPDNLSLLLSHLASLNYKVLVAESGASALRQVNHVRPDLILLDILMPGMDGFETCSLLKSQPVIEDIPVIFLSALDDAVDKVRGFQVGGVDFITKPIDTTEVSARINLHLLNSSLMQRLTQQNQLLKETVAERDAALALQKGLRAQSDNRLKQLVELAEAQGAQLHNTVLSLMQSQFNDGAMWDLLHRPVLNRLTKLEAQLELLQASVQASLSQSDDETIGEHVDALVQTTLLIEGELLSVAPRLQSYELEQPKLAALSNRESAVLGHIADGFTSEEIALKLSLSPATVRTYRTRIMNKLEVHNIPGLVKFAIRHRLSSLD